MRKDPADKMPGDRTICQQGSQRQRVTSKRCGICSKTGTQGKAASALREKGADKVIRLNALISCIDKVLKWKLLHMTELDSWVKVCCVKPFSTETVIQLA